MFTVGAHLSIAGGYVEALKRAKNIGANALQIFSTSPRGWNSAKIDQLSITQFLKEKKELSINPIFFHASYLINLADGGDGGKKSVAALVHELTIAAQLHVVGSIVHTGSYKGKKTDTAYQTLLANIAAVLKDAPPETLLILENAGTRKIGQTIDELAEIIRDVKDDRVRVCLDTCHLHAAGYDISSDEKLATFLKDFDTKIGLSKISLWHLNDSRDPFGSLRDRHDNIGEGAIGKETFKRIINHPQLKHLPFIIETPGFNDRGPDKKNIDILRGLRV